MSLWFVVYFILFLIYRFPFFSSFKPQRVVSILISIPSKHPLLVIGIYNRFPLPCVSLVNLCVAWASGW